MYISNSAYFTCARAGYSAIQTLTDYGLVQPLNDMPTHYPELFVKA